MPKPYPSFPQTRESILNYFESDSSWIPAYAGMTSVYLRIYLCSSVANYFFAFLSSSFKCANFSAILPSKPRDVGI